jgi:hypothetical protein
MKASEWIKQGIKISKSSFIDGFSWTNSYLLLHMNQCLGQIRDDVWMQLCRIQL